MPAQNENLLILYIVVACIIVVLVVFLIITFIGQYNLIRAIRGLQSVTQEIGTMLKLLFQDHEQTKENYTDLKSSAKEAFTAVMRIDKDVYKKASREDLAELKATFNEEMRAIDKRLQMYKTAIDKIETHLYQSTINPENRTSYPKSDLE